MELEIWKKIEGYNDYEVSNTGRVRSLKFGKEKILKANIDGKGYHNVILCKNGKTKSFQIHQLVAIAFLNHKPNGYEKVINHKNHVRTDNYVDNLEVITQRENTNRKHIKSSSKFTGVCLDKQNKKWKSSIRINRGKPIHLGFFSDEAEAGKMYELALANISLYNGSPERFRQLIKTIRVAA